MLRALAVLCIVALAGAAGAAWWAGSGPVPAVETPDTPAAPELVAEVSAEASARREARRAARSAIKIGSFEAPEDVPGYDILQERRDRRDGARGAWLLVATRPRDEDDYALVTRHIKSRYAHLDAVSVEYIDLTRPSESGGAALIFNTAAGADYIGYIYGPPNTRGYYIRAVE